MGHLEETEWVGRSRAGSNWTGSITGTSGIAYGSRGMGSIRIEELGQRRQYDLGSSTIPDNSSSITHDEAGRV